MYKMQTGVVEYHPQAAGFPQPGSLTGRFSTALDIQSSGRQASVDAHVRTDSIIRRMPSTLT